MWLEQIQIWTGHLDLQCKSSNATRTRWKSMDGEASPLLIWIDWLNLWAADSFQTTLAPPLTALADWTALVRLIFRVHTFCLRAGRNRTQHLSAWLASTFLTRRHLEKNKLAQWEGDHKYTQWKHAFLINSLTSFSHYSNMTKLLKKINAFSMLEQNRLLREWFRVIWPVENPVQKNSFR